MLEPRVTAHLAGVCVCHRIRRLLLVLVDLILAALDGRHEPGEHAGHPCIDRLMPVCFISTINKQHPEREHAAQRMSEPSSSSATAQSDHIPAANLTQIERTTESTKHALEDEQQDDALGKRRCTSPLDKLQGHPRIVPPAQFTQPIALCNALAVEVLRAQTISAITKTLDQQLPQRSLLHCKRVRKVRSGSDTKLHLLVGNAEDVTEAIVNDALAEFIGRQDILPAILVLVPASSALSRAQFEQASLSWPSAFHEDKHFERAVSGQLFDAKEQEFIRIHLAHAVRLANQVTGSDRAIGCVFVDRATKQVIAASADRTSLHPLRHSVMNCIEIVAQQQLKDHEANPLQVLASMSTLRSSFDTVRSDWRIRRTKTSTCAPTSWHTFPASPVSCAPWRLCTPAFPKSSSVCVRRNLLLSHVDLMQGGLFQVMFPRTAEGWAACFTSTRMSG
eukprot:m.517374 g.517374  ORF g.517374 m.517374 type:complete len:449 (-) comp57479_c0_seq51:116-1462(-)